MMTYHVVTEEEQPSPRYMRQEFSRLQKNNAGPPEIQWSACLGQRAGKARQAGRARRAQRGGIPLCPRRAFLACLALHAPRSVALADFFSILVRAVK